jgi:hypothetical protein
MVAAPGRAERAHWSQAGFRAGYGQQSLTVIRFPAPPNQAFP